MGFFDFLRSDNVIKINVDRPSDALKIASQYSVDKEYDLAIELLEKTIDIMEAEDDPPSIEIRLRLPAYLRSVGRNDEAWGELNRLLATTRGHREILPMYHSKIYTAMRIHLQKEGEYIEAIRKEVLSVYSWMYGLHLQKRRDELINDTSIENIEKRFKRILKKADLLSASSGFYQTLQDKLRNIPKTKIRDVINAADDVIKEGSS